MIGRVRVDLMIPVYGDGDLLRETVDSVLAQDSAEWRLTLIDDRVDDAGQLGRYVAGLHDERVRYVLNARRLGINRNFQRCLDEAREELVVVLGADDRLLPHYVSSILAAAAQHPDAAWIHPGVRVIDGSGAPALPLGDVVKAVLGRRLAGTRPVPRGRVAGGEALATSLLQGNWMYFPSCAFRRSVVTRYGFRTGFDVALDLDLYLRMLLDGHAVLLLDEICFEYRRHALSLSSTEAVNGGRFAEELRFFAEQAAMLRAAGWRRASRASRWHLTSRLHAGVALPAAVREHRMPLARQLAGHVFGVSSPRHLVR